MKRFILSTIVLLLSNSAFADAIIPNLKSAAISSVTTLYKKAGDKVDVTYLDRKNYVEGGSVHGNWRVAFQNVSNGVEVYRYYEVTIIRKDAGGYTIDVRLSE